MLTDEQLAVNEYPLRPTDSDPQSGYIELGPVPVSDETGILDLGLISGTTSHLLADFSALYHATHAV